MKISIKVFFLLSKYVLHQVFSFFSTKPKLRSYSKHSQIFFTSIFSKSLSNYGNNIEALDYYFCQKICSAIELLWRGTANDIFFFLFFDFLIRFTVFRFSIIFYFSSSRSKFILRILLFYPKFFTIISRYMLPIFALVGFD